MSQSRIWMWSLPIIFYMLMFLDGQLSFLMKIIAKNDISFNIHLLLFAILIASFHCSRTYLLWVSTLIGLLYDSYYYGLLGIQAFVLPIIVLFIYWIFKHVSPSFLSLLGSMIIFITLMEGSTFLLQNIFQLIHVSTVSFIIHDLGPTLALNTILFILLYYPIRKLMNI